jgi:hypothetical protein
MTKDVETGYDFGVTEELLTFTYLHLSDCSQGTAIRLNNKLAFFLHYTFNVILKVGI